MTQGYTKGAPDHSWWLSQVRSAIKFRQESAYQSSWKEWRNWYRGDFSGRVMPKNLFYMMIRSLVPRVYFRNPSISIRPGKPGYEYMVLAQILERVDNKLITKMRVKEQIKLMIQDAFLMGTGIVKIGYGAEFTPSPEAIDTEAPVNKKGDRVEYNDLITPNSPWFLRCHPGSFLVPKGSMDIHGARWVGHWVKRHIDDVRSDPRLRNNKSIEPAKASFKDLNFQQEPGIPADGDMCDLIEIRDRKTGKVFILAPYNGVNKPLYFEDDELQVNGKFPFRELIFNRDTEVFWGLPDAKILDPQQREINEVRTLVRKHRKQSIAKVLAEGHELSQDMAAKLENDDVNAVITVEDINKVRFQELVREIPNGLITADAIIQKDVMEILGLGSNQFGEYTKGSEKPSATEASIVNMATQIRVDERRDAVADLLVDSMEHIHHVIFERWTGEQVVDIVGPLGIPIWVKFTPDMLKPGSYDIRIDPDSSLPETKQMREAKAIQMYGLLRTNPLINPVKLTQFLLTELHGTQFDDLMVAPQGVPGMTQQNPVNALRYAAALPQLLQSASRALAGPA